MLNTATHKTTVTGGSMAVYNGQSSAKDLITSSGFVMTNGDTYFKLALDCALEAGDVISVKVGKDDNERGVWLTTATSRPSSAPTATATTTGTKSALGTATYTVATDDGIIGENTIYIYRATDNSTYFNNITITRPEPCTAPTGLTKGTVTVSTCPMTVTDAANTNAYEREKNSIDSHWGNHRYGTRPFQRSLASC